MTNESHKRPGRPRIYNERMAKGPRPLLPAHVVDALETESRTTGESRSSLVRRYLIAGMRQCGHEFNEGEQPDAPA